MRLVAIALITVTLAACSARAPEPRKTSPPTAVRIAFERNFMKACLAGVPGQLGSAYCACTRDAIEDAMSDLELSKVTPSDPRVRLATHGCAAKTGLPIRPGY
jgi:hypothetical protein